MARVLWTAVLLLSVQLSLVASQKPSRCGLPVSYPDKRLDEKYALQREFQDGQRVAYKCVVGFRQNGGSRVSYCRNGRWEPPNMTCTKKRCGSAGDIENGRYEQDGNEYGDKAYAKCKDGFVLKGESVRECLDNGWSGTIPTCEAAAYSLPVSDSTPQVSDSSPPVSDSTPQVSDSSLPMSDSSQFSRSFSSALRTIEVMALTCPHPKKNNFIFNETKPVYKPGESLSVSCNVGSSPSGNFTIKCEPTGSWTPRLPKCSVIKCPKLNIIHSKPHDGRVKFNTTVKITCEEGFQLKGADTITCAANGSWTPVAPTCGLGECEGLPHYPKAQAREDYLSLREFQSGAVVRFKCAYGYRWTGGRTSIRCENGRWTPLEMRCEKKSCGSAGEIQNGRFQYTGVSFGDTATAKCDEGYELIGVGVRLCRGEGWDGRVPVCEVVHCPMPPAVPGAELTEPIEEPIKYGNAVSYRCLSGSLIGEREIYCTEKGTWNAPPPQCREISCPVPSVRFGLRTFGIRSRYSPQHIVRFTCNPGYNILGSEWVTCGTSGNWEPELPKCVSRSERFS